MPAASDPGPISVSGSMTTELSAVDYEQMVARSEGRSCNHVLRLPLYLVGGSWCCDRCVGLAEQLLSEAEQARRVKEANPLIFALEIVTERVGRPLSLQETVAIRRSPRTALRLVGVAA